MNTLNTALELPSDLYNRLEKIAKAEKIDPITLIEKLLQSIEQQNSVSSDLEPSLAPLYQIHEQAIDMGVTDLAQNLDHYLYGLDEEQKSNI